MDSSPCVLLVGSPALDAWREIEAELKQLEIVAVPDIAQAVDWLDRHQHDPALIVVAESWPGEISEAMVASLRRRAPLARLCSLVDSWCEGEMRSGKPWPGTLRVYCHQWPQRAARELQLLVAGQPLAWALPVTAGEEERLLAESEPHGHAQGRVAVIADNPQTLAALTDAVRSAGYTVLALRDVAGAVLPDCDAAVWDTTVKAATDARSINRLKECIGSAPVIALLGFPRPGEVLRSKTLGIAAVVSKPFLLADLHWQLASLIGSR